MGGGEDPTLHRDTVRSVDDHGRAAIVGGDAQPEERVAPGLQKQELYPIPFRQAADVAQRFLRPESDRLASGLGHLGRVPAATRRRLESLERSSRVELGLQSAVGVEPLRRFRQNLLLCMVSRPGAESHNSAIVCEIRIVARTMAFTGPLVWAARS